MRISIGTKLVFSLSLAVALTAVMALYALHLSQVSLKNSVGNSSVLLAESILKRIDHAIHMRLTELRLHAGHMMLQRAVLDSNREFERLPNIEDYMARRDEAWKGAAGGEVTPFMKDLIDKDISKLLRRDFLEFYERDYGYKVYTEIIVTNKFGANVAQTGKTSDFIQSDEPWWQHAREKGLYVSDVKYDESAETHGVHLCLRVDDEEGRFIGVMKFVVAVKGLAREAEIAVRKYETTRIKLITREGRLIYGTKTFTFLEDLSEKDFYKNIKGENGFFVSETGGRETLYSFATTKGYRDFEGLGWILLVGHDAEEVLKPVSSLRNHIIVASLVLVGLGFVVALFLSRTISTPLEKLRRGVERIGEGDLEHRVSVESGDEIGELAVAFNEMVEKRLRFEAELHESEDKYRTLAQSLDELIYSADPETFEAVYVNKAVEKIYGYTAEEWVEDPTLWGRTIHPEDRERVFAEFTEARKNAQSIVTTYRIMRSDNTVRWVEDHASWQKDRRGNVAAMNGVMYDVTERKQYEEELRRHRAHLEELVEERAAELKKSNKELENEIAGHKRAEQALRKSEERFRELAEMLPEVVFESDIEMNLTFANQKAFNLFGYSAEDFKRGLNGLDMVAPEERKRARENVESRLQGRDPGAVEYRGVRKDGTTFPMLMHMSPIVYQGAPTGFRGVIVDITERKQTEEELRESEKGIKAILSAVPTGIGLVVDRKLDWANSAMYRIAGYEEGALLGQKARILYPDDMEYKKVGEALYDSMRVQGRAEVETRWVRKDGEVINCLITACYLDPAEPSKGQIVSVSDITQLRTLETQLRQSQKMEAIGSLAGGVAHDFNNLLTTIMGNADLALMDLGRDEPLRSVMEEIRAAGERAAGLTAQLLAFSRKQILQLEVLDLNEILPAMDKMLRRIIGEDIELETLLAPDLGLVEADRGQVEQVIMNLAVNARDAMPEGGRLIIETANADLDEAYSRRHGASVTPGGCVMLAVSDTGTGMSSEVRAKVFDPFFTTKEKGKGTGLGLSTVYGIVKQSNGHIWAYSEPGKGTSFKIYLPRVEREVGRGKKERAGHEELRGSETVLVVEDDENVKDIAKQSLRRRGYTVLSASDGGEALRVMQENRGGVHLVLTDVVMPGMSGRETVEELKKLEPDIKVLYMSGYTDNAIVHHGVLDHGVDFIQKPFTPDGLAKKVREVLSS